MKNYAQIEGKLGADAVTKDLANNKRVTRFSVAINKTWKKNGQTHTTTDWIKVAAWGKLTAFASKLKKGHPVMVQGELRTGRYKDSNGVEHQTVEIVAISIRKFDLLRDAADTDIETGEVEGEAEPVAEANTAELAS
jgi:single-strand DNA-binding protein